MAFYAMQTRFDQFRLYRKTLSLVRRLMKHVTERVRELMTIKRASIDNVS